MAIKLYPFWGGVAADSLSAVATSGAYSDLTGRPALGTAAGADVQTSASDVATGKIQLAQYLASAPAILDSLRRSVEAGSGGLNTVLYANGEPNYVRIVPAYSYADLGTAYTIGMNGTGVLEAFLVNTVQKPYVAIGLYPASLKNGYAVSQPCLDPWNAISYDEALAACAAMGAGWRLMSAWDWAAITHQCMARGYQPKGNTDYGRAHDAKWQGARRVDGGLPGVTTGTPRTLAGTGPNEWNHDNSSAGIADLVGNVWEWHCGAKITEGVVSFAADNGAVTTEASWINSGFTMPGNMTWGVIANAGASDALKRALIVPATGVTSPPGWFFPNLTGERLPIRGGYWGNAGSAGLAALNLDIARSNRNTGLGFRPAFVP